MTAAERSLYDAHYRLQFARQTGRVPRSIGNNSADIYANPIVATPERLAELEQALQEPNRDPQRPQDAGQRARELARLLGVL